MPAKRRVNLLLVDDSPANLVVMQSLLGALDENLVLATSGQEALERLLEQDFAAILLDVRMPVMDGFETAKLIRGRKKTRQTPIIFVTAEEGGASNTAVAYAMGAVDFLTKPIVPAVLLSKVSVFVELSRSKEELRAEQAFLHAVLESVDDAIVACDPDGRVTLTNRAAAALCKQSGMTAQEFFCASRAGSAPHFPLVQALGGEPIRDAETLLRDGLLKRTLLANSARLQDSQGRHLGAVMSLHDVTAAREVQQAQQEVALEEVRRQEAEAVASQLRESQDRLERLAADLSLADRRKTEFLATLAHELRNPMAPLANGLRLLRLAKDNPQVRDSTYDMMERQIQHMVRLVDDLLDVARITSGKVQLQKERVEVNAAVNAAVESCAAALQAQRHSLSVQLPDQALHLNADPVRLSQVLCNLLTNAIKYTPAGGAVGLTVEQDGDSLKVEVIDTGVGIAEAELPHVFDLFTQVEGNLDRSNGGLGIGLSLVKSFVQLHGGTVAAASQGGGKGSTFTVHMPLMQEPLATPVSAEVEPASMKFDVLVVDDNVDAAQTLASVLEFSGHRAQVANGGLQALEMLQVKPPDVMFLDLGMPGMNGYEVARSIRQRGELNAITLIALTGWGADRDRQRTADAGFDFHLTKPADIQAIDGMLRMAQAARDRLTASDKPATGPLSQS